MGLDLDIFDFDGRRRSGRRSRGSSFRSRHRHMFAWIVMAGGTVLLGLLIVALLSSLGVMSWISSAYFAGALALLPSAWHDDFKAIPDVVHVLIVLVGLGLLVGLAGEIFG
jgi:hypothetical protein